MLAALSLSADVLSISMSCEGTNKVDACGAHGASKLGVADEVGDPELLSGVENGAVPV